MKKVVVGLDFGTSSARALMVDALSGEVIKSKAVKYARGILDGDTVCVDDYTEALELLLDDMSKSNHASSVCGICVDATSLTLVCLSEGLVPLEKLQGFETREHARVKLWKRHSAEPQAAEALSLAKEMEEPFLLRSCETLSAEWTLPKLLEMRDNDYEVYKKADIAFDLCEYLTFLLTGEIKRSIGSMSFKGLWSEAETFPSDKYLNTLRDGLAKEYKYLLRGEVLHAGKAAGVLLPALCKKYGFADGCVVAAGVLDGHTSQVALGALNEGDAALVVGTSNVFTVQTDKFYLIKELCGIAENSQIEGLCGVDSGQACTGDMLAWYLENALPKDDSDTAEKKGIGVHELLCSKIKKPWTNKLCAADWWNGSRNVPRNDRLAGVIYGMTLKTRSEDIYLTLLQSIACGTRSIIERCEESGVKIKRIFVTGGIALKNPTLMQEYSNILNRTLYVGTGTEGPALGAAIFASVAANIYEDVRLAAEVMGNKLYKTYLPDEEHRSEYENIYARNCRLRELISEMENE
ncbi:MAG: ribulokinase [Clostridia bacterium]|nr:ribulokinase [Clostridia bacterium]